MAKEQEVRILLFTQDYDVHAKKKLHSPTIEFKKGVLVKVCFVLLHSTFPVKEKKNSTKQIRVLSCMYFFVEK